VRSAEYRDVIERALARELAARRELRPHAQLAIPPDATPAAIEEAWARLRGRYDPTAFDEHGPAAVAAARSIRDLLIAAYESMRKGAGAAASELAALPKLEPAPRRDETCRALETLRGAIERRLAAAEAHRAAGRADEAMRAFQSVLVLDRRNEAAERALRELRAAAAPPKRPSTFSRMFGRMFGRRVRVVAERAVEG
jgi:tetratricopeptide (TPR) repeat protein